LECQKELKKIDISLITYDIENYTYQIKEDKENLDKLNDEIIKLSSNSASYDLNLLNYKDKLKLLEDEISVKQGELIDITRKIETIDADIRVLKERKKYNSSVSEIENNIIKLKEEELKINTDLNQNKNSLELENKKLEEKEKEIKENINKLNGYKSRKNDINTSLSKNNRMITDIKYKIEYLENSINNSFGIPNSVKSIINNPRFDFVHDVIGNLIDVEDKYSVCVQVALGGASNYLVVDTSENAKDLVNYLKENNLGRATFFPLDVIRERFLDMDTLSKLAIIPTYVNTLDKLVKYDKKYENIIKNQMGNVIVATDIGGANYISKIINHKYKIVTLDGQLVNVGGSVTGGSQLKGTNILKEKYELDENIKKMDSLKTKNTVLMDELSILEKDIIFIENEIDAVKSLKKDIEFSISKITFDYDNLINRLSNVENELKDLNSISNSTDNDEVNKLLDSYYKAKETKDNILTVINSLKIDKESLNANILEIDELSKKSNIYIQTKEKESKELELKLNTMNMKIDNLLINLSENYNMTFEHAKERYKLEIDSEIARDLVKDLKYKLKNIGCVNIGAIEEYDRIKTRYDFLDKQRSDLNNALCTLMEIIKEMDEIMADKFITTFEQIRKEFKLVFREMFRGGDAELILTDPDNILETGIEIKAVPSGKTMKSLSLLSGGEKTFTAISLLFAILNIRPVPFCLLDEVEAALDDANVESFGNYLDKYRDITQFILITHKKKTMEFANTLYGVTMQESGVSKLVSVKLEDIKKERE